MTYAPSLLLITALFMSAYPIEHLHAQKYDWFIISGATVRSGPIKTNLDLCSNVNIDPKILHQVIMQLPSTDKLLQADECRCVSADGAVLPFPPVFSPAGHASPDLVTPYDINLVDPRIWRKSPTDKYDQIALKVILPSTGMTFLPDPDLNSDGSDTRFAVAPSANKNSGMFACRSSVLTEPMSPSKFAYIVINREKKQMVKGSLNIGLLVTVTSQTGMEYSIPLILDPMVPNKG